ncbi:MAG: hypothetical protein PHV11_04980 [Candidatus Bipolaricaulis sp.]|nr:hypothetical protein [Candidatus Bipolaricaulis sp.]
MCLFSSVGLAVQLDLRAVEQSFVDQRLVDALVDGAAPRDKPDVERVPENLVDGRAGESVPIARSQTTPCCPLSQFGQPDLLAGVLLEQLAHHLALYLVYD